MIPPQHFTTAVSLACPGRSFKCDPETYEGLEMLDDGPKPSLTEINQAWQAEVARQAALRALSDARAAMAEILDGLNLDDQADYFAVRIAVEAALDRGRLDLAQRMVERTPVPPHLEDTKAALLDLFPA
jgi:hypothetical protein